MDDTNMIVVTGPTGNVGSKLVRRLLDMDQKIRVVVRSRQRLEPLKEAGIEIVFGDVLDAMAMTRAFIGAKAVFTMIPPNVTAPDPRRYYNSVSQSYAAALRSASVSFVVNLSSIGAHLKGKTGPILGLHDHEERLNGLAGLNILHLRPASFMENLLMQINVIRNKGTLGLPLRPDLKIPMIATKDIAAEAAERLTKRDFSRQGTKELLGQRDLTMNEATQAIGQAIGLPSLTYAQLSFIEAKKAMTGVGLSAGFADSLIEMDRSMNEGLLKPAESRTEANTTPTSIEEFVEKVFLPAFHRKETVGAR